MNVTSFQDSKLRGKLIFQPLSYCELIDLSRNGTIVGCLYENKKMSVKSVFHEVWSPEMTSHSFLVSCFGLAVLYPTGSEISRFWYMKNRYGVFF